METINLIICNNKLIEIEEKLQNRLPELRKLEEEYENKYFGYLLNSPMGNAPAREAEAKLKLQQEPIFREYQDKKLDVRILYSKREMYIEISKNLRALGAV